MQLKYNFQFLTRSVNQKKPFHSQESDTTI